MHNMPSTPLWLKKAAWFSAAALGLILCALICIVEHLLEGGFPWAFLILCVVQVCACVASALFCGKRSLPRPLVYAVGACAILLSVAVILMFAFWVSFFRT